MDTLSRLALEIQTQQSEPELELDEPEQEIVPAVKPLKAPQAAPLPVGFHLDAQDEPTFQRALNELDTLSDALLSHGKITPKKASEIRTQYEGILSYLASTPSIIIDTNSSISDKNKSIALLIDQLSQGAFELSSKDILDTHTAVLGLIDSELPANTLRSYGLVNSQFHLYAFNMAPRGEPIATALTLSPAEYTPAHEREVETFCKQADSRYHEFLDQVETGRVIAKKNKLIAEISLKEPRPRPAKNSGRILNSRINEKARELIDQGIWTGLNLEREAEAFQKRLNTQAGQVYFFGLNMPTDNFALTSFFQEVNLLTDCYVKTLRTALARKDEVRTSPEAPGGSYELLRTDSPVSRAAHYFILGKNTNNVLAYGLGQQYRRGIVNLNDFSAAAAKKLEQEGAFPRTHLVHTLLLAMNDYSTKEKQEAHHVAAMPPGYLTQEGLSEQEMRTRQKELHAVANASDVFEGIMHLAALRVKKRIQSEVPYSKSEVLSSFEGYDGVSKEIFRLERTAQGVTEPLFRNSPMFSDIAHLL